ncbi:MAG: chromate efflux transporter [Spirosomataceae bacterium]
MRKIRYLIFLKDVLILALTSFGGPQVHLALFIERLVKKHGYIKEEELLELNALCQILPGPTSTQTITAVGYKIGGPNLAYLTLLVWITPAVLIMTFAAFGVSYLKDYSLLRFVQPIGVAFLIHAGYSIGIKVIKRFIGIIIMVLAAVAAYVFQSPWICPIALILGGSLTAFDYKAYPKEMHKPFVVPWANFFLWVGFFVFLALLGHFTDERIFRLFENFYRNGSLVFGGGTVLGPMLFTEFVEFKEYLRADEFLSGMALSQAVPGPIFSLTSYVGVLSMRDYGFWGKIAGSIVGAVGIFLPGAFLIFFVYRIWSNLKTYRPIRASLEGINAVSIGLTLSAAITFFQPIALRGDWLGVVCIIVTLALMQFTKIPAYAFIALGLLLGYFF